MSLKVWLPLNGNLDNQGASSVTITNSNATIDNNGKIGKCYRFNKNAYLSIGNSTFTTASEMSFCLLLKINSFNAALDTYVQIGKGGTPLNDYTLGLLRNNANSNLLFAISNGSSSSQTSFTTPNMTTGILYHIACVYKSGHCLIYINGTLYSDNTTSIVPKFSDVTSINVGGLASYYKTDSYINDFRIYDHALSAKEVKEISKGLVVHYPLNGNQSGLDNILINTADLSKLTKESGITCTYDSNKGIYKIEDTSHTSSRLGIYQDISVNPNTFYTLSCTLEGESCGIGFGFFNGTPTNFPSGVINVTSSDGQVRKTYSAQSTSTATYCRIYLFTNCGTSKIAYFKFPKLELGSIATPWIPNSTDTEYSAYGYNSLIELDISGYKNHGTKTKIMNIDVNTPRYNVCTIFDGTNDCILTPFNSVIKDNNYTISVWVKKSVIGTDYYQTIFGGPSGFELEARNGQTNEAKFVTLNLGKVSYAYNFNQLYHFVFVHSSSDSKLYIDGTLIGTGSTASIPSGNYYVGSWRDTTSQNFEGQMSDFRIYATALSADDVKELYSSSASIANNGTVMCYEFNEE